MKKAEYMKQFEGDIFEGVISNVTSFGMFLELDNTVEGLVRMADMHDDYYEFNEKQYCLKGERTHKIYRIGDVVKVLLARANAEARQIDFVLV
jgi:ribonuclease R